MWIVAGILTVLTLVATSIEEHELGARFGAAYEDYSRQVTPFAPVDAKPREG
jgi:protein-S-isoprenylcysteine O-methyltransferase Ste14